MNNKGVKTPQVLPWIPGGVDKKDSRNKFVHKKSEERRKIGFGTTGLPNKACTWFGEL